MAKPSKRSALNVLTRAVLLELADAFDLEVLRSAAKAELIDVLASSKRASFARILESLKRSELKEICRAHGLDDSGKEKAPIRERILAGGASDEDEPAEDEPAETAAPPAAPPADEPPPPLSISTAQLSLVGAGPLSLRRILESLDADALAEVAAHFGFVGAGAPLIDAMVESGLVPLRELLERLPPRPLQALARAYGADGRLRARERLIAHLIDQARHPSAPRERSEPHGASAPSPATAPTPTRRERPKPASDLEPSQDAAPAASAPTTPPAPHLAATSTTTADAPRPATPSASPSASPSTITTTPPTPLDDRPAPAPPSDGAPRRPTPRSVLALLPRPRLVEIGRLFNVAPRPRTPTARIIDDLVDTAGAPLAEILGELTRDELRLLCEGHGLDPSGRARGLLAERLLAAAGDPTPVITSPPAAAERPALPSAVPAAGEIVRCRHRSYMVEETDPPAAPGEAHRVRMVCLDDDDPGRPLEVLWELELGAQVLRPDQELPAALRALDEPRHFAAYLHALKWNCVTASDGELFQAPFRAGIALSAYQLTPLLKALELPRANLFIADDVGLGKTIEAGLVLQELLLRQRVDYVLVVAPPAVCLQWQGEMARRFGLAFEVHDRAFVARRRRERGFGVNPWATHNRFIISYPLLRRPEYLEPLLAHLAGRGKRKTLLILDEAHTVAPATASHYAVDSRITRIVRDALAPAFENRLFLSATPHNGHSNSFSALLEILDPQRFTRGVRISGPEALRPVMVRRLKRDIRHLADTDLPERRVPELLLWRDGDRWLADLSEHDPTAPAGAEPPRDPPVDLGPAPPLELELAALLREYSALIGARTRRQRLVFINLQKRLLSSIAAFHRTLGKHALTFDQTLAPLLAQGELGLDLDTDPDTDSALAPELDDDLDPSDRALADADDAAVEAGTRELKADRRDISADARARALLEQMLRKAAEGRALPDARVRALVAWIRRHMCPAAGFEAPPASTSRAWSERRIIVFTESLDTKRYLRQMLRSALRHAGDADDRIMELHGAMADDRREAIQRAFNAPPAEHPVRILLATDAAREGINLQGACADLFHFDIPWNPARMEQRNGRIDRTLQPADVVRCAYFRYRDRPEDLVLAAVIRKVATIHHELGSLGAVIQDQVAELLEGEGIDADTAARLEAATALGGRGEVVRRELDDAADDRERAQIRREIARASKILHRSRQLLDFDNALLRDTIDVALERMGHGRLAPAPAPTGGAPAYLLPPLPATWDDTLDALRPPRPRDVPPWEHRRQPPQPVVFDAPKTMASPRVHLHLHHPFVRRVLDLFLAQGHGAHDLQRVTVVRDRRAGEVRVLAFGRLSLFGRGAVRLHDILVPVVAPWASGVGPQLGAGDPREDLRALDRLESLFADPDALRPIAASHQRELVARAAADFALLWPQVQAEADAAATEAAQKLARRGEREAAQLRAILETQRAAIQRTLGEPQLMLAGIAASLDELPSAQRQQLSDDRAFLQGRLAAIDRELRDEPGDLEALYEVKLRRLEPVGVVYLWPEMMA